MNSDTDSVWRILCNMLCDESWFWHLRDMLGDESKQEGPEWLNVWGLQ